MTADRRKKRGTPRPEGAVVPAVREIAERLAAARGLMLWDVTFTKQAGRHTLRVACDRRGGVDSSELAGLADDLSRELDHADAVPGDAPYILEVTSPGAERALATAEEFDICHGRVVKIWFADDREPIQGEIGDVTDGAVEVVTSQGPVTVAIDGIAQARLQVLGVG